MKNLNSEEVIIDDDKQVDINEVCKKIQKSKVDEQVKLVEEQKQKEEIDDMLFKEEKQQEIIQQLQKLQEIQEMQQKFQQKKRKTNQSLYIKDINEIGNNEIDELQQEQITAVLEDSQQQQDEDEQNRRIILNELNRRKMNRKQSSFINLSPSPSSNQLIMSPPYPQTGVEIQNKDGVQNTNGINTDIQLEGEQPKKQLVRKQTFGSFHIVKMEDGAGESDQNLDLGNEDEEEEEIEEDDDLQVQKKQLKNIDDEDNIEMVLRRLKQQVAQKLKEQNNQEYELNDEQKNNDNENDNEDDWGGFVDDLIEEENGSKEKDSNNNNNNSTINYNADMSENTPDDQRQKHQLNEQQLEILSLITAASDGEVAEIAVFDVVTAEDANDTLVVSGTVETTADYAAADAVEAVLAVLEHFHDFPHENIIEAVFYNQDCEYPPVNTRADIQLIELLVIKCSSSSIFQLISIDFVFKSIYSFQGPIIMLKNGHQDD
ncbi:MAG: hypothetical protein EZS28_004996 [Streblomastix strix]|uniref:Uncharacterized protein n=1 Tax=Streblomastix strix TaxID=222440 RepID=A0A5J4WZ47_9EUKA|nr:MAG: hypothetical protein EZS28_004996 [Streblomastix strix]